MLLNELFIAVAFIILSSFCDTSLYNFIALFFPAAHKL